MKRLGKLLLTLVTLLSCIFALASCSSDITKEDITGSLKLTSDFEGKSFIRDGIGEVTLTYVTDGDTATFTDKAGSVTLRYFSVDTPESTGDVDKWGLAASNYAKEVLGNAVSFVLESDTAGAATTDTYGRYLGYVWYKSSEDAEYRNFNLELVENGWSLNTSKGSGKYLEYFQKAEEKARTLQLHVHSSEDDPLYSSTPMNVDLKYINEHLGDELYYKMVAVEGYIKSIDGAYIELENYIDDEPYSMTVYLHNTSATFLKRQGNLIKVVGTMQTYSNRWQISGVIYNQTGRENSSLITEGYYLTFGYSVTSAVPKFAFEALTVTSVKEEGNNYVFTGTTNRINDFETVNVTFTVAKTKEITISDYEGKQIKFFGFNEEGTSTSATTIDTLVVKSLDDISIIG